MNSKTFLKVLSVKIKQSCSLFKKLAKSYVSLFLIVILSVSSTVAWFAQREAATLKAQDLEFQSASSLRINKDDPSNPNRIVIKDFYLDEASSVDGRNIYFPLDASFTGTTSEMYFREGNAGDGYKDSRNDPSPPVEHRSYVYEDFELKGTSNNTPVYIKSYKIEISDPDDAGYTAHHTEVNGVYEDELKINYTNGVPKSQNLPPEHCPIRIAFIADSADEPVVIDPSAQVIDYVDNSDAVALIGDDGSPIPQTGLQTTNADAFASYYYGKTPLFMIPGGQVMPVTIVIWLEGTLPDCDKYIGKKISVDIDIESNFAEMETIKFIDQTSGDGGGSGHWVDKDNTILACSYKDPYSTEDRYKTVIMSKSNNYSTDYTWTCKIPKKAVTDISFYRLNPGSSSEHHGTIWNSWHTALNISAMEGGSKFGTGWKEKGDLQTTRQMTDSDQNTYNSVVYTAIHGNGWGSTQDPAKRLAPGVGYWDYSGGGTPAPTQAPTQSGGGGGSSESTYSVTVIVYAKGWVESNVNSGSKLHFQTSSGGDYQYTSHSGAHFEQTFTLNSGDEITGFYLQHMGGSKTNLSVNSIFTVSRNVNVVYTQQNNDTLTPNLNS